VSRPGQLRMEPRDAGAAFPAGRVHVIPGMLPGARPLTHRRGLATCRAEPDRRPLLISSTGIGGLSGDGGGAPLRQRRHARVRTGAVFVDVGRVTPPEVFAASPAAAVRSFLESGERGPG
jgi:hypothetical protein